MAIFLGGHFQIREHYLGGHFDKCHESSTKQCNEHDMKLKVTAMNSKHPLQKKYDELWQDLYPGYL